MCWTVGLFETLAQTVFSAEEEAPNASTTARHDVLHRARRSRSGPAAGLSPTLFAATPNRFASVAALTLCRRIAANGGNRVLSKERSKPGKTDPHCCRARHDRLRHAGAGGLGDWLSHRLHRRGDAYHGLRRLLPSLRDRGAQIDVRLLELIEAALPRLERVRTEDVCKQNAFRARRARRVGVRCDLAGHFVCQSAGTAATAASMALGLAALVTLRGCPICWTTGLVEMVWSRARGPMR